MLISRKLISFLVRERYIKNSKLIYLDFLSKNFSFRALIQNNNNFFNSGNIDLK
jgi:hypothetical protein